MADRSRVLLDIADRIERRADEFAAAESRDQGKPLELARSLEIPRAAANLRFFATAITHEQGEFFRTDDRAINYVLRQPRGVAGCISPWNLPLYLFTWKIAPALVQEKEYERVGEAKTRLLQDPMTADVVVHRSSSNLS